MAPTYNTNLDITTQVYYALICLMTDKNKIITFSDEEVFTYSVI